MATVEFTEERRFRIIALLALLTEGIPEQRTGPRKIASPGFVNEFRDRDCPDCLANGRPMIGCETCGGGGTVSAKRVGLIASPDAFADDGEARDPYMTNETRAFGLTGEQHDRWVAIDAAISRARNELRRFGIGRPTSTADEIAEANRNEYPWERTRKNLRKRYDLDALTVALDALRDRDPSGSAVLRAVYVYREAFELSTLVEEKLVEAIRFVSDRMPDPIRAPGAAEHPAATRQRRRAA